MKQFLVEPWYTDGEKCKLYSVRFFTDEDSETDKFFEKYRNSVTYREEAYILFDHLVNAIADRHGAIDALFNRFENEVIGLPMHGDVVAFLPICQKYNSCYFAGCDSCRRRRIV